MRSWHTSREKNPIRTSPVSTCSFKLFSSWSSNGFISRYPRNPGGQQGTPAPCQPIRKAASPHPHPPPPASRESLPLCQSLRQYFKAPWVQHSTTLCLLFNPGSSSAMHMAFSFLNSYINQGLSTWLESLVKIIQLPTKFPNPHLLPGSCLWTLPFSASIRETYEETDQTEAPVFIFAVLLQSRLLA